MLLYRWGMLLRFPGSGRGPARFRGRHVLGGGALLLLGLVAYSQLAEPEWRPQDAGTDQHEAGRGGQAEAGGGRQLGDRTLPDKARASPPDVLRQQPSLALLFSAAGCSGAALRFPAGHKERKCGDCMDLCGQSFDDGTPAHTAIGGMVRSLRVVEGRVRGSTSCVGTYGGGEKPEWTWSADDGCVDVTLHLAHVSDAAAAERKAEEAAAAARKEALEAAAEAEQRRAAAAVNTGAAGPTEARLRLEMQEPYRGPPPGILHGSVRVYAAGGCSGQSLTVKATHTEAHCARCFDVCRKTFGGGAAMHSSRGSTVRSLRVEGGATVTAYRSCLGSWPRGAEHLRDLKGQSWTEADGCVESTGDWDHLRFSVDDALQPWWQPTDFVGTDGRPLLAYGPLDPAQRPQPLATEWWPTPPELPWFDMQRTEADRAEALSVAIDELRQKDRTEAAAQELALLLMVQRQWAEARDVLERALAADSSDPRTRTFLGHALEGMRGAGLSDISDRELAKVFFGAKQPDESPYGSESAVVDTHYAPMAGLCCQFSPRHSSSVRWYRRAASEAVADSVAYYESLRLRTGMAVPQLRALGTSRGPEDWNAAETIRETTERFARSDIAVIKEALPPFVHAAVRRFYRSAVGECKLGDEKGPVCTVPEPRVFPPNSVDPFVQNAHSDRVGFWINQYLRPLAEAYAGRHLTPMYSYMVRYHGKPKNHGLEPHLDMVDNEYTMSVSVDYFTLGDCPLYAHKARTAFLEDARGYHYPIYKRGWPHMAPGDAIGANLSYGDAILFRGRQHAHYRPPFILGTICHATISHFVDRDYVYGRGEHNNMVCCDWPPLARHNRELCACPDPARNEEKQRRMLRLPL